MKEKAVQARQAPSLDVARQAVVFARNTDLVDHSARSVVKNTGDAFADGADVPVVKRAERLKEKQLGLCFDRQEHVSTVVVCLVRHFVVDSNIL